MKYVSGSFKEITNQLDKLNQELINKEDILIKLKFKINELNELINSVSLERLSVSDKKPRTPRRSYRCVRKPEENNWFTTEQADVLIKDLIDDGFVITGNNLKLIGVDNTTCVYHRYKTTVDTKGSNNHKWMPVDEALVEKYKERVLSGYYNK